MKSPKSIKHEMNVTQKGDAETIRIQSELNLSLRNNVALKFKMINLTLRFHTTESAENY